MQIPLVTIETLHGPRGHTVCITLQKGKKEEFVMNVPEPDATFWVEIPQPPRPSRTDPEGSWTGLPDDPGETPVQDADDL